jgi:hypothetical protein
MNMKYSILFLALSILPAFICFADTSDDTLKFYLSKSDLVVVGRIVSEVGAVIWEFGVPNYICDFEIQDVIKGDENLKDKKIKVNIMRFEMAEEDKHPLIKKDSKCILFLKKANKGNTPEWVTADVWFGIQHPFPWMIKSLKRLAKEGSTRQLRTEAENYEKFGLRFWKALSQADLQNLAKFYALEITLLPGTEFLKKEYGINADGDRDKNLVLKKDDLMMAYKAMIKKVGTEKWKNLFSKIDNDKISFTKTEKDNQFFDGVKKDDIVMDVAVGEGTDKLSFVFRKGDDGNWAVVMEDTDY